MEIICLTYDREEDNYFLLIVSKNPKRVKRFVMKKELGEILICDFELNQGFPDLQNYYPKDSKKFQPLKNEKQKNKFDPKEVFEKGNLD
jgi:hypothetical protein